MRPRCAQKGGDGRLGPRAGQAAGASQYSEGVVLLVCRAGRGYIEGMDWKPFIHTDPAVCGGRPVIKGTRITIEMILEDLTNGATPEEVLQAYPHLPKEAIPATLAFASEIIRSEAFHLNP